MTQKTNVVIACAALVLGALSARGQTTTATTTTTTTPAPTPAPATPAAAPAAAVPAAPAAPTASWTITPSFVSQYMFRGVRLGGTAFQPAVEYDYDTIALGVWMNFPMANKVDGQSDPEIDPYGSYTIAINDNFSVVPGFTWYTYPHAPSELGFFKASFEPNLAVNYTIGAIKFTPKLYYDLVLHGPTVELNATWALPLKNFGTELDFLGTIGAYKWKTAADNTYPDLKNYGSYYLAGVSAPFTINAASKVIIGFAYTQGWDNYYKQSGTPKVENTAAVGRGVVSISYAYTF
jgi:uncharacterized protein (TIGR02001 family)